MTDTHQDVRELVDKLIEKHPNYTVAVQVFYSYTNKDGSVKHLTVKVGDQRACPGGWKLMPNE